MRDDQIVLGNDRCLHVVADDPGATATRRHRATIGIGQRDLPIWRGQHLFLDRRQALHLLAELRQLLLEPRFCQRDRLRRLLQIGRVELGQIARHALFQLLASPLHFRLREVFVAIIDRLEFAAVDRNARFREQPHLAAEFDEAGAHLAQRFAVVLAEVGDGLVIRDEAPQQPHHLDVAASFTLEPPARLHPVEITVDVELQVS